MKMVKEARRWGCYSWRTTGATKISARRAGYFVHGENGVRHAGRPDASGERREKLRSFANAELPGRKGNFVIIGILVTGPGVKAGLRPVIRPAMV